MTFALTVSARIPRPAFDVVVELKADPGSVLAVVGPNGAGKSSAIAAIAGFTESHGTIRLGDKDLAGLPADQRRIGVMFQDLLLFPHLTVRENVAFSAKVRGGRWSAARRSADPWLSRFGMADLAERYPSALSGGQAQRVALARALASEPKALLLDEPLAALDVEFRDEVRADLGLRLRQFAGPTILVTHDREDVEVLADEVIVLEAGRITQRGSLADLARNPATAWIARFTGAQGRRDADDVRYG